MADLEADILRDRLRQAGPLERATIVHETMLALRECAPEELDAEVAKGWDLAEDPAERWAR